MAQRATAPVSNDSDWETISGPDEWEDISAPAEIAPSMMQSRQAASKSEFEANQPESTVLTRLRELLLHGAEGAGVDLQSPIIGTAKNIGTSAYELGRGLTAPLEALPTLGRLAKGIGTAVTQGPKDMYNAYQEGDYDKMAGGAGRTITATLPAVYGAAKIVGPSTARVGGALAKSRALNPESLMTRAANNRAKVADVGIPASTAPAAIANAVVRASRTPRAYLQEQLAKYVSKFDTQAPPPVPASNIQSRPEIQMSNAPQAAPEPLFKRPSPATPEIQPSAPLPTGEAPPESLFKPRAGERAEIPFDDPPLPEVDPLWTPKQSAQPTPEIEFGGVLPESTPRTPDLKAIEAAIAPSGTFAQLSTLRNAPQLIQELPELAGLQKGREFDTALMSGFRRKEAEIVAAEAAVAPETVIAKSSVIEPLKKLAQDYTERGLIGTAGVIDAVIEKWNTLPDNIPWNRFRATKRAFFDDKKTAANSAPMRRAYGVVMDAASVASAELARANKSYSIIRRALENAKIDRATGRRISEVGKEPQPKFPQQSIVTKRPADAEMVARLKKALEIQ